MVEGERKASGTQEGGQRREAAKSDSSRDTVSDRDGKRIPSPRDVTDSNKKWQQRHHRRHSGWGIGAGDQSRGKRIIADIREKTRNYPRAGTCGRQAVRKAPANHVHVRARRASRWGATACCVRGWGRFLPKTNPSPRTNELANTDTGVSRPSERKISERGNKILSHKEEHSCWGKIHTL